MLPLYIVKKTSKWMCFMLEPAAIPDTVFFWIQWGTIWSCHWPLNSWPVPWHAILWTKKQVVVLHPEQETFCPLICCLLVMMICSRGMRSSELNTSLQSFTHNISFRPCDCHNYLWDISECIKKNCLVLSCRCWQYCLKSSKRCMEGKMQQKPLGGSDVILLWM